MDKTDTFLLGILLGTLLVVLIFCFTNNGAYEQGVYNTHKEAYEHGLMVKEISKDDKVIYRWIETHKLGYV
jgi:hypothetical protein